MHYIYRTTTDKLAVSLDKIVGSGDSLVGSPQFVGGRDWIIVARTVA